MSKHYEFLDDLSEDVARYFSSNAPAVLATEFGLDQRDAQQIFDRWNTLKEDSE